MVYALGWWMDQHGMEVVYLPTYSPEFNPIKLAFNKMKPVAKQEKFASPFTGISMSECTIILSK